ncbi:MAG: hypothetical protein MJ252_14700 [archaeon]|nr:hypothetical protein [archaeon]
MENKFIISSQIAHDGDVNKAVPLPSEKHNSIIASQTASGEIHIFDYLKHKNEFLEKIEKASPEMILKTHEKEGFGLSWSKINIGSLVSGNDDGRVCLWQINEQKELKGTESPIKIWKEHSVCNDVGFNKKNPNIIISCGEEGKIILYDIRQNNPSSVISWESELTSVDFSYGCEYTFLVGGVDNLIGLYDMRNVKTRLHDYAHHKGGISAVRWNENIPNIFASCSKDNKIFVWDILKAGISLASGDDYTEGPSELLFVHNGHFSEINDFNWNPKEEMMGASVSNNNCLHIWSMRTSLYKKDEVY